MTTAEPQTHPGEQDAAISAREAAEGAEQGEPPEPGRGTPTPEPEPTPEPTAEPPSGRAAGARRFARSLAATSLASLIIELAILWDFGLRPVRTALRGGIFSNFFDLQARAILDGHLHLPRGSLNIEGFVIDGHEHTYFPPFPALLRVPVLAVTDRFDGRLTAPSMLLAWIVTAVVTGLLLWRVRTIMRGDEPVTRTEVALACAVQATVLCGSVMLYLASMPWVYHEVYAWSIPLALGCMHSLVGVMERPSTRRVIATGAWALGAIWTRTTAGWACVAAMLAVSVLVWRRRAAAGSGAAPALRLAAAGLVPLAAGIAVNWAKFRHPFMFPLESQVWTQLNPHRRDALAANGGDLVSPRIVVSTGVNYLRPDGLRLVPYFPFITMPAEPARSYGGAVLDQSYRTASVTASAPLLLVLAAVGYAAAFRRTAPPTLRLLRVPMLGAAAIVGGIMFYGYIAYRYTSEFIPGLVIGSVVGATVLTGRLRATTTARRRGVVAIVLAAVCYGIAANAAFAVHEAAVQNTGGELRDYVIIRDKVSAIVGRPLDHEVRQAAGLPRDGPADRLQIVGDCDALFLGTGEMITPWAAVEIRETAFELRAGSQLEATPASTREFALASLRGLRTSTVSLEDLGARTYRLLVRDAEGVVRAESPPQFAPDASSTQVLVVRPVPEEGRYLFVLVTSEGVQRVVLEIPFTERDADWFTLPVLVAAAGDEAIVAGSGGWHIERVATPRPTSCTRLLDE